MKRESASALFGSGLINAGEGDPRDRHRPPPPPPPQKEPVTLDYARSGSGTDVVGWILALWPALCIALILPVAAISTDPSSAAPFVLAVLLHLASVAIVFVEAHRLGVEHPGRYSRPPAVFAATVAGVTFVFGWIGILIYLQIRTRYDRPRRLIVAIVLMLCVIGFLILAIVGDINAEVEYRQLY